CSTPGIWADNIKTGSAWPRTKHATERAANKKSGAARCISARLVASHQQKAGLNFADAIIRVCQAGRRTRHCARPETVTLTARYSDAVTWCHADGWQCADDVMLTTVDRALPDPPVPTRRSGHRLHC